MDIGNNNSADYSFDHGQFHCIVIHAGGGDDLVWIDETNGVFTDTHATTIFGGSGNDTLLGGSGSERFDGGPGDDTLLGSNGADVLLGGDNNDFVDGQQGNDVAFLGAGDDTFQWDPGDGSDTVEGQAGTDKLLFNGSGGNEIFNLSANGTRLRLTRDLGNIVMDLDDVARADLQALGGHG